jgi:hypothetical protein
VSKVLAEGAVNLEDTFEVEIKSGDEGDFNLEKLKAPMGEEWTKVEANATAFTPSVLQWSSIAQQMFVLMAVNTWYILSRTICVSECSVCVTMSPVYPLITNNG